MKSVELSIGTSKRPRVEASTAALATSDQPAVVDPTEEIHVHSTIAVDPIANVEIDDPTVTPLSLRAMMKTFMTTQVANGQLIDEILTEVVALRADFAEYRSAFPPPPLSDP